MDQPWKIEGLYRIGYVSASVASNQHRLAANVSRVG